MPSHQNPGRHWYPSKLAKETPFIKRQNLKQVPIWVCRKNSKSIKLGHGVLDTLKLLITEIRRIPQPELISQISILRHRLAELLVNRDAILLQSSLCGLQIGNDETKMVHCICFLWLGRAGILFHIHVEELEVAAVVVFESDHLLGCLVGRAVPATLTVAHVGEGEVGGCLEGEHVAHAKDVGIEGYASGEVVDVEGDVIHEVAGCGGIGGCI